jgi:HSP20 family protein
MTNRSLTRRETSPTFTDRDAFFGPFLERFLGSDPFRAVLAPAGTEELSNRGWVPAVDIKETEEAYVIHAELAGLKKDDITITLENNVLRLSGERRFEKKESKDNFHRIERAYGSFSRAFTLGSGVAPDKVKAEFEDGVLTLTVPKAEETKPRKISIA